MLYSWVADVNIRLMITEAYLEPSRRVMMGFFAKVVKAVNYYCEKSSIVDVPLGSNYATSLGYCQTILSPWLFRTRMDGFVFCFGKIIFFKKNVYSDTSVRMDDRIIME